MPHKRDLSKERYTPTYEVDKSHHYRQSRTHKADLTEMQGPIYSKAMSKHSYTGGYISPRVRSVERDSKQEKQQQLVSKYFAKDASKSVIKRETLHEFVKQETKSETKSQVTRQNIQVEQAQQSGQIRKQEALMRREEFKASKLEVTSTVDGKVLSTAEIAQLNAKREEMIRKEVEKIQNESKMMMERYLEECKRRTEMIQKEEEMRVQQEREQKELMKQRMLEHEQKEKARKEELKRQEELLTQKHLRAEEEARRREQEAKLKEEKRLSLAKVKKEQDNRAEAQRLRDEERKAVEGQREKARMEEEERRRREMERLQNMKNKQQEMMVRQKQEVSSTNVELKYYGTAEQRPGDQHGFGFGNVQTGQVSTRKMTFLTRSSSAGPEDRAGLNPDLIVRTTSSARASPMPFAQPEFTTAPSMPVSGGGGMKMMSAEEAAAATKTAAMQWSQQSSAIAKTDFASSTKALGTGLARRSPVPLAPVAPMAAAAPLAPIAGAPGASGFTQMSSMSSSSSSSSTTKQVAAGGQQSVQFS